MFHCGKHRYWRDLKIPKVEFTYEDKLFIHAKVPNPAKEEFVVPMIAVKLFGKKDISCAAEISGSNPGCKKDNFSNFHQGPLTFDNVTHKLRTTGYFHTFPDWEQR